MNRDLKGNNGLCLSKENQYCHREVNLIQSGAHENNFTKKRKMAMTIEFSSTEKGYQTHGREVNLNQTTTHENTFEKKLENMQIAKIIQKFYSKSGAQAHAQYLRAKAKKENVLIANIEIVNAYELYKTNGWFKKSPFKNLGMPSVDTYMVIVHRTANVIAPVELKKIQKKIKKAVKNNTVRTSFFIVKLSPPQINEIEMSKLTLPRTLSTTLGFKYKHLTQCSAGKNKIHLAFHPLGMHYSIAA